MDIGSDFFLFDPKMKDNAIKNKQVGLYQKEEMPILLKFFSKNYRGKNTPNLFLWGHYHPGTETRLRYHQKRILDTNNTDEHRCKNPPQNTSKLNPTIC